MDWFLYDNDLHHERVKVSVDITYKTGFDSTFQMICQFSEGTIMWDFAYTHKRLISASIKVLQFKF